MIHIIEINENFKANVWFAYNEQDLIRKIALRQGERPQPATDLAEALQAAVRVIAQSHDFRIYADDAGAADELDGDPFFRLREGMDAGYKLRRQLIELDILADDF